MEITIRTKFDIYDSILTINVITQNTLIESQGPVPPI